MSDKATLLFLHGVGTGDQENKWSNVLARTLTDLGYPDLDAVNVLAPKYPNTLRGADDDPLPGLTIKVPTGEEAKKNRRDFERRMGAVEIIIGRHDHGAGWFGAEAVVDAALAAPQFVQAKNYLNDDRIRAQVLNRVLRKIPKSGRLVIVGHSLGSVIAADVVRRLPADLHVDGMVTIGSPLSNPSFDVRGLRSTLKEPPTNLAWWVNFWNEADPVAIHRGLSSVFPWMVDFRVKTDIDLHVHDACTYLSDEAVATAIGYALFGSRSKDLAIVDKGVDIPLDYAETTVLMALRHAYLTKTKLEGDQQDRYANALRQVQANTFDLLKRRCVQENRPLPAAIANLAVDRSDPQSVASEPTRIHHLSKEEAIVPLTSIATTNVIRPFEISVTKPVRLEAFEDLTIELGLGRQFGRDVFTAAEDARKALTGSEVNWIKMIALGVGATALVAATGGLALAAAPGVAGAAAITSALAAFGPGGMIGGLLTAGALASAGGGGLAIGLASPTTTAETVEAIVWTQLTAAILRKHQGIEQDPSVWNNLVETEIELQRELTRLKNISDDSAPTLKELKRKLETIDRALNYLTTHLARPGFEDNADNAKPFGGEFLDRVAKPFRAADLDGDGIPDKPRARVAVEDAGAAVKGAMAEAVGAFGAVFRRKRTDDASADDTDSPPEEPRD